MTRSGDIHGRWSPWGGGCKKVASPRLHPETARWLVDHRKVKAFGLDTPSIDYGQTRLFENRVILFEKNIPALKNIARLGQLPEKGFTLVALPMKIKGESGDLLRIVANLD